jgi:hypothetical protein
MNRLLRVTVSANRRFLQTETGAPFFWLGDTAWELFHRLTVEEAEFYLENRRRKGLNVIQAVALAEFDGIRTPNAYGDYALTDEDPTRPNEAYFRHVDAVIDLAAAKGLYVGLLPTWADKVTPMWGAGPAIFTVENAHSYGRWLGARYKDTFEHPLGARRRPACAQGRRKTSGPSGRRWQRASMRNQRPSVQDLPSLGRPLLIRRTARRSLARHEHDAVRPRQRSQHTGVGDDRARLCAVACQTDA